MPIIGLMLASLALVSGGKATAVKSTFDESVDFGALHTYRWTLGATSFYADPDALIVAAIDAEMTQRGFTKTASKADVAISYFTVASTYLDLEGLHRGDSANEATPTRTRSTLAVTMRQGTSSRQIWTASTREFIDPDPAKLAWTIRRVAARLFETYPVRTFSEGHRRRPCLSAGSSGTGCR